MIAGINIQQKAMPRGMAFLRLQGNRHQAATACAGCRGVPSGHALLPSRPEEPAASARRSVFPDRYMHPTRNPPSTLPLLPIGDVAEASSDC